MKMTRVLLVLACVILAVPFFYCAVIASFIPDETGTYIAVVLATGTIMIFLMNKIQRGNAP